MQCSTDEKRNGCGNVRVWVMVAMLLSISAMGAVVPVSTQTLVLKPGWNLVALTRPLESMQSNLDKFLSLKPFAFDNASGSYMHCVKAENLKPGDGYWVFCPNAQTVELALDVKQAVAQPTLRKGWNLVGMTDGASWPDSAVVIWGWKDGRFVQVSKSELQAGKGYWAFFND